MRLISLPELSSNTIELNLSPSTMKGYLTAIGLFRSIHQQLDNSVRASWKNNRFILHTDLTKEEIVDFYLNKFEPLPLFCTWDSNSKIHKLIGDISTTRHAPLLGVYGRMLDIRKEFEEVHDVSFASSENIGFPYNTTDKKTGEVVTKKHTYTMKKLFIPFLFNRLVDQKALDIIASLATPYTDKNNHQISVQTPLGSQSGYLPGKNVIDSQYWNSILALERKHIENVICDAAHPDSLVEDVSLDHLDSFAHWNEQDIFGGGHKSRQSEASSFIKWNGKKVVWGSCPFTTMMMVEGMCFFRGRAGLLGPAETKLKGVDFDEVNVNNKQVPCLPFVVKNTSVGTNTGNWSEHSSDGGVNELWAPLWDDPIGYTTLLSQIRDLGEVAQVKNTRLTSSRDMMLFLSQHSKGSKIEKYSRFVFLQRFPQGHALSSHLELFNVEDDERVDVLQSILPIVNTFYSKVKSKNVCVSVKNKFLILQGEVDEFMRGRSSMIRISEVFADFIQQLRISLGHDHNLVKTYYPTISRESSNEHIVNGRPVFNHSKAKKKIPKVWIERMEQYFDEECRVALSLATNSARASSVDISHYLSGYLNQDRIEKLRMFFEMCVIPSTTIPEVEETPWFPLDFRVLTRLFNIQGDDLVDKDKRICRNLLSMNRTEDAMDVAVRRLRMMHRWHTPYAPVRSTNNTTLLQTIEIPFFC